MVYESVQRYESGFSATLCRRPEGGFVIRLNNEEDVECAVLTVEGVTVPPTDIAEAMEVGYRAGRDDGVHETKQKIKEAIERAWKGATHGM